MEVVIYTRSGMIYHLLTIIIPDKVWHQSCRFIMTERKQLKKKLAKLKHYKANLPRLIDCSSVYGDDYYSKDDFSDVDKQIEEVEKQIAEIDSLSENGS